MRKILEATLKTFAIGGMAGALAQLAIIEGARTRLGGGAIAEATAGGGAFGAMEVIRAKYKFSVDGGGIGAINLMDAANVPAGFVVWSGFIDVIVVPTSGGAATIALGLEGAADLQAAAPISGAPWSTVGRKAIIPVSTPATSIKTTVARNIAATVAVAALTAGEFDVYLMGVRQ